jgi:SagB-type dehydrogenase family enzyme
MLDLSFREDVTLSKPGQNGALRLQARQFDWTAKKLSAGMRAAFQMLAERPVAEDYLVERVIKLDGAAGAIHLYRYLKQLSRLICYRVRWQEALSATLVPFAPLSGYQFEAHLARKEQAYRLSRFAYCRRDEADELVLESVVGDARVLLCGAASGALFAALAQPHCPTDLATIVDIPANVALAFTNLLLNAGVICEVDAAGGVAEEADPALAHWEFPDLLFHKHSRMDWKEAPYGGTYRFQGTFEPLPLIKSELPEEITPLNKPDLEQLATTDESLSSVLERRRSIRQYGEEPLTIEQLGEFLYRTARIKQTFSAGPDDTDIGFRPYPAGGALCELEIYPVVKNCRGLQPGLYYYHPLQHQLHKVAAGNRYIEALLYQAWTSADRQSQPQVLLAVTARFQRLQWKYASVTYALILKHVGTLMQTMYLVATAMGLAPCSLGGGDSALFARAAGLNYYAETTVGEFLLGSRPTGTEKDASNNGAVR